MKQGETCLDGCTVKTSCNEPSYVPEIPSENDCTLRCDRENVDSQLLISKRKRRCRSLTGLQTNSWVYLLLVWIFLSNMDCTPPATRCPVIIYPCAFAHAAEIVTTDEKDGDGHPRRTKENMVGSSTSNRQGFLPTAAADEKAAGKKMTLNQILLKAGKRSIGGGLSGAIAGAVQVLSLMWLRTIINYQSRYGTTFAQALRTLLHEGGIARLYRGVTFALIQAPLSRFASTAANDGIESLLSNLSWTKDWGPGRTTVVASIVVGFWRIMLMPIDTMKTVLQVDSVEGFRSLLRRVKAGRISVLYEGSVALAISAMVGHYPWFFTFNYLSASEWLRVLIPFKLVRNAGIGIASSIVSDTVVNALRVIKTTKQSLASKQSASYADTVRVILAVDGWRGLFGRGLRTRIFANALQSIVFTIIWRGVSDHWKRKAQAAEEAQSSSQNEAVQKSTSRELLSTSK